jgi:hypothetical protein
MSARGIGGGDNDAPAGTAAHNQRFAGEFRILESLDGGIECV